MSGLTATGFTRRTYVELVEAFETWQRDKISPTLVFEDTFLGDQNSIVGEHLAQAWEVLEAAVGALDPDNAVEALLVGLCKLNGVYRRPASKGVAAVDCTFDRATTIAAGGCLLFVTGEPTNLWTNPFEIVATAAGTVTGQEFRSTVAGAEAVAAATTLDIATPITGLTAVNNPLDATPGTDQESLDDLRLRREASLAAAGKATVRALDAAVSAVSGVIDVRVIENDTDSVVAGQPPHTVRCLVWDGATPAAADVAIAQAIYDTKAAGMPTYGATSANAVDPWDGSHPIYFDRVDDIEVDIVVDVEGTPLEAEVKAAILAAHKAIIGEDVVRNALIAAVMGLSDTEDVTALTIEGVSANLVVTDEQVGVLDSSRITVNYV